MATCEMCGTTVQGVKRATIEGTIMNVCARCVRFGVEIAGPKAEVTGRSKITQSLERRAVRSRSRDIYDEMQEELVADYGSVIRGARLRKGFPTTEDLGKKILEKKSILDKVEAGSMLPSDALVKKLERELDIKLMEKPESPAGMGGAKADNRALTLGDLIKKATKKD